VPEPSARSPNPPANASPGLPGRAATRRPIRPAGLGPLRNGQSVLCSAFRLIGAEPKILGDRRSRPPRTVTIVLEQKCQSRYDAKPAYWGVRGRHSAIPLRKILSDPGPVPRRPAAVRQRARRCWPTPQPGQGWGRPTAPPARRRRCGRSRRLSDLRRVPHRPWLFAITEGLTRDAIPYCGRSRPGRNRHRAGRGGVWSTSAVRATLRNPRYTAGGVEPSAPRRDADRRRPRRLGTRDPRCAGRIRAPGCGRRRTPTPLSHWWRHWKGPRPAAAGQRPAVRRERTRHPYLLYGRVSCALCGRKMQRSWNNGRAHYRCLFPAGVRGDG
jgi:hypothetical protein